MADCLYHGQTTAGPCPYCEMEDAQKKGRGTIINDAPLTAEETEYWTYGPKRKNATR